MKLKKTMNVFFGIEVFATAFFGTLAIAQTSVPEATTVATPASTPVPGFLPEFQYQVTQFDNMAQAQAAMDIETTDTRQKSICGNRAQIWTYMMRKQANVQAGKVFIHFTKLGTADENKQWDYHVAPYVIVNGKEMVLDHSFDVFKGHPTPLSTWTKYFGKSEKCVVLDPIHNPTHLKYEHNNLSSDKETPLTFSGKGARQYPTTEGICYIRKVPMYYFNPMEVYAVDLYLAGDATYARYLKNDFDQSEVLQACRQAMSIQFRLNQSCNNYLGLNDE